MFEKFDEAANDVIAASRHECMRLRCIDVLPEHLLLALTRDPRNIAARALSNMNISADNIQKEMEQLAAASASQPAQPGGDLAVVPWENIYFSAEAKSVFDRAIDCRRLFGRSLVAPEHLLLGILDLKEDGALKILEELGVNLTFLRRQVLMFIAQDDCLLLNAPAAKPTVIVGISEMIAERLADIAALERLSAASMQPLRRPERAEIVLMVLLAYLPEFLLTQVAYQRYLLEETLRMLQSRTGTLDKETIASMVSVTAQNLRKEVRSIIEHLWTQEYRMLSHLPDESEHEEIGSVIEDLWWTYSEEIALHDGFDEALDDYRRKHVLNLQKGKIETSQRLTKLRLRLEEIVRQCFLKRSMSA